MEKEVFEKVNACLSCKIARCETGCPVHNNIRDFIYACKQGEESSALEYLYAQNPFPELTSRLCDCDRQCQGHCVKGIRQTPVSIQEIERYLSNVGSRDLTTKRENGKSICIIGAGIAGLCVAYLLRKEGYAITVVDQNKQCGGAIYTGIPAYRFDHTYLQNIQEELTKMGVSFQFETKVDHACFQTLQQEYDRVVVAIGAQVENLFGLKGKGYLSGLELLKDLNVSQKQESYASTYHKAIVWGGGNVAMDCARSLKRCMEDVTILYRRSEKEMPANVEEIQLAKEEGITFAFLKNIDSLALQEGSVHGIYVDEMELLEKDESGRAACRKIEGSTHFVPCDLVVAAIGQKVDFSLLDEELKKQEDHKTNLNNVYVCGDCYLGPKTVAACIQDGKEVAKSIIDSFA